MAWNGWKWLQMSEMTGNGWKCLEMSGNGWKQYGVGPVDNRSSTDKLHHFVKKNKKKYM